MADYLTNTEELTTIANAIRAKGGTSATLVFPSGFATAINNIPSGTSQLFKGIYSTSRQNSMSIDTATNTLVSSSLKMCFLGYGDSKFSTAGTYRFYISNGGAQGVTFTQCIGGWVDRNSGSSYLSAGKIVNNITSGTVINESNAYIDIQLPGSAGFTNGVTVVFDLGCDLLYTGTDSAVFF